ncbi:hypothetical protein [Photobacterium indicum]|uniref:hypothetical protein n=1 Tax=Photobacterium indicum TaxID=81447 RepID=UPI003D0CBC98
MRDEPKDCNCFRCRNTSDSQRQKNIYGYKPKATLKDRLLKQRQDNYEASEQAFAAVQERRISQANVRKSLKYAIADGVYVWIEVLGVGHSFISIIKNGNPVLYSYGRYGSNENKDGVLLIYKGANAFSYMRDQLFLKDANVFKVSGVSVDDVDRYYSDLYKYGDKVIETATSDISIATRLKASGRVIDVYDLSSNNCTTHVTQALTIGGLNVDNGVVIPLSLREYLSNNANMENVSTVFNFYYSSLHNKEIIGSSLEDVITGSSVKVSGEEIIKIKKWIN